MRGQLVPDLPGETRIWMPLDSFPALLTEGYVAVEDVRFWDHRGVDGIGVLRAAIANIREGGVVEGASTITMQLARTIWGNGFEGRNRWIRKVGEVRIAWAMERELSKDQILESTSTRYTSVRESLVWPPLPNGTSTRSLAS